MVNIGKWKFPKRVKNTADPDWGYKRECLHCGTTFYARYPLRRYCSYRCRNDAWIQRRKQYREMARLKVCEYCGEEFKAKRKDAKYCSDSHRVLAFLKRNNEG